MFFVVILYAMKFRFIMIFLSLGMGMFSSCDRYEFAYLYENLGFEMGRVYRPHSDSKIDARVRENWLGMIDRPRSNEVMEWLK